MKTNQIINYDKFGEIDLNRSIYYNYFIEGDSIFIKYYSMYNDSIRLVVGNLDTDFRANGLVDTLSLNRKEAKLYMKDYYLRGKLSFYKLDSTSFRVIDLFINDIKKLPANADY